MKTLSSDYLKNEKKIEDLLKDSKTFFVFDSNILLNFYLYNKQTLKETFSFLENNKISDKLWIPYQVANEFLFNRLSKINEQNDNYNKGISYLKNSKSFFEDNNTSLLLSEELIEKFIKIITEVCKELEHNQIDYKKFYEKDTILDEIIKLFDGKVGVSLTEDDLFKIADEGDKRYKLGIPPGFKDKNKDLNSFGDLIIWKEIIEYAKKNKCKILFITEDVKEDWWFKSKDIKIPHPKLIKEFKEKTSIDGFYMSNFKVFIEKMKTINKQTVSKPTIENILKVQKYNSLFNINEYVPLHIANNLYLQDPKGNKYFDFIENYKFPKQVYLETINNNLKECSNKVQMMNKTLADSFSCIPINKNLQEISNAVQKMKETLADSISSIPIIEKIEEEEPQK